jgi:predicted ferric reductase
MENAMAQARTAPRRAAAPARPLQTGPATWPRATREAAVAAVVAAAGVVVIAMWAHDTPTGSLRTWGTRLTAAGDLTGLVGTYLVLVQIVLMGRVPPLERLLGMDRLAVWHRRNGQYSICLLVAHAFLTIWGYGLTGHAGLATETRKVVLDYPDMLAATVGLGLFVLIGAVSVRAARSRLRYQTWYFIHLYAYLAIALSFAHQFATGTDFITHPANRGLWIVLYVLAFAPLVWFRFVAPARSYARHRLRVASVVPEGPSAVSVYVTGAHLDEMGAESGQFFLWRFLTRDRWWQAHPFSLSAAPNDQWLRITAKDAGDFTGGLASLKAGTRVIAEGPYGAFTARRRRERKVLLVAGGIGITPLRALLESLPGRKGDFCLLYRASTEDDLVLRGELDQLAERRGAVVHYLVGPRGSGADVDASAIRRLCGDLRACDAYVCGPPGFTASVRAALHTLGVPAGRIHTEEFAL